MRFIVELYRLIILGGLALGMIVASFVVCRIILSPDLAQGTSGYVLAAVFVVSVFMILSIGITATFISMHDRLEEIARSANFLASERDKTISNQPKPVRPDE